MTTTAPEAHDPPRHSSGEELTRLRTEVRVLVDKVARLREQQAATGEIARSLGDGLGDLPATLHHIAATASRLCEADGFSVFLERGDGLVSATVDPGGAPAFRVVPGSQYAGWRERRTWATARCMLERRTIHVPDLELARDDELAFSKQTGRRVGHRALLVVPLMHQGTAIGALSVRRISPGPFTDQQVALLESLASHAAVAAAGAMLVDQLKEQTEALQEALDQQTATAGILRVIAGSGADLKRALDAIAHSAARLTGATGAALWRVDGDLLRRIGFWAGPGDPMVSGEMSPPLAVNGPPNRAVLTGKTVHVPDMARAAADGEFASAPGLHRAGVGSMLAAPLLRDGQALGALVVRRLQAVPFTPSEIALLETFAAQAVIAIENARLFSDLHEENERKRLELERASSIQDRLLPTAVPCWPGRLEIAYRFRAATETSGDFYDVVEGASTTPDDPAPLQIAVADVAGKGMGAALVMSLARAGLRFAATSALAVSPASTARIVADRLHRDVGGSAFVACALATVERDDGAPGPRLRLVNAGQAPVLLCRAGEVREIDPPGERLPLGTRPGLLYLEATERLLPGDVVVFCSDGLPEAPMRAAPASPTPGETPQATHVAPPAKAGEFFGFQRVAASAERWAGRAASAASPTSAEEVAAGIWQDVTEWCGANAHHDDMTLLVLRVPTASREATPRQT